MNELGAPTPASPAAADPRPAPPALPAGRRRFAAGILAVLAVGLLASLAAVGWLPLAPDDPLRGTVTILPLAVAAFAAIERAGRRAGGRGIAATVSAAELAATALLAAAALARPRLGFALPPEAVYGGLVLLLGHRTVRQALALRPLLGWRLPERPSWLFALLPLTVYLALLPWHTERRPPDGDEPYYLLITHSLAYDFDAELTDEYAEGAARRFLDRPLEPQPGDPVGPNGEQFSRHNLALPLVLAPLYRVGGLHGALGGMAAIAALLAWVLLRLMHRYHPERPGAALAVWGLFAFTPPMLFYSVQVWVEVPAALLGMIALDRIRAGEGGAKARGPRHWLAVALPILAMPLLKIRFVVLAAGLLALAWWHSGRRIKPALALGAALGAVAAAILLHNELLYDNALKHHHWGELEPSRFGAAAMARGFSGLFFDGAFGLFTYSPVWLLLIPAALLALRRGSRVALDLAAFALPYLVLVAPRGEWYGGWSPPFRYALVALPLLAVALVPLLADRRRGGARALLATLAVLTLALIVVWLAVPGWTYSFADGRGWLGDLVSGRLDADFARLVPSSIRVRPASWLVPAALAVLVPLLWWRPRRLRRATAWGAAGLLLAFGAAVVAAERLPTRVAHFEDAWIEHRGGVVHPGPWVTARSRYRGGWVLREGESLTVPVVAGGAGARLTVHAQLVRNQRAPLDLELRTGERLIGVWRGRADRRWSEFELGPLVWPAGEPLVVEVRSTGRGRRPNGVVLDRVEIEWLP